MSAAVAAPLMARFAEPQPSPIAPVEPPQGVPGATEATLRQRRQVLGGGTPDHPPLTQETDQFAYSEAAASTRTTQGLELEQYYGSSSEVVMSAAEISKHKSAGDAWVVVDGVVFDISQFVGTHPGGVEVILEHLHSQDLGKLMRGEEGPASQSHAHTSYAFRMLQHFRIGRVVTDSDLQRSCNNGESEANNRSSSSSSSSSSSGLRKDQNRYTVDLSKPLVFQVGKLGADYDRWVHDPIVQKEPPRFFESDIAEFFTRTAWWVIPVVWVPVVIALAMAGHAHGVWLSAVPFLMAAGAFIWTFVEYLLHRYIFHMKTTGYWSNTAHYFLHGFHHKHPMDGTRLVFPPAITAILVCIIWYVTEPVAWVLTSPAKECMFSGGLLAYVAYDLTHYFLHFGTPRNEMSRMMKSFHLDHHFREHSNSYGVTTPFWDTVFGTFPDQHGHISILKGVAK